MLLGSLFLMVMGGFSVTAESAPTRLIPPGEILFSCSDIYSQHPFKATLVGRVPLITQNDYRLQARVEAVFIYEGDRLRHEQRDLELQGQGFVTGMGGTQFDLVSRRKIGEKEPLNIQVSLKNDSEIVFSYVIWGEKKYRTICSIVKNPPVFSSRPKMAQR